MQSSGSQPGRSRPYTENARRAGGVGWKRRPRLSTSDEEIDVETQRSAQRMHTNGVRFAGMAEQGRTGIGRNGDLDIGQEMCP